VSQVEGGRRVAESVVEPESEGLRIDVWLSSRFTYRSRAQWQDSVRKGEILLNGAKTRPSRALKAGERVAFQPDSLDEPEVDRGFKILQETPRYLVIDKPGNLPCHPAGRYFKNTLWSLLAESYGKLHIVNRLDRETSGLTIAAKDNETASKLGEVFSKGLARKSYIAIVHGRFPEGETVADGFLEPDKASAVNKKRRFVSKAEPGEGVETAKTVFRLRSAGGGLSEVEALPETGRLHQIRATLHSLGFPMAGDKLYGVDERLYIKQAEGTLDGDDFKTLLIGRQALHAARLEFPCPFLKGKVLLESQLPDDMAPLHRACSGV